MDGTVSVVILKKAIEMAGGEASFHVPHRLKDGYGMRAEVIERAAAMGSRAHHQRGHRHPSVSKWCAAARERGIDVIVTDHHLPEAELPPALAVLNPNRRDCSYPDKNLCGAGVAFKLVQALLATLGWPAEKLARVLKSFLKLVAIATVADVVPLVGENRVIVKHGLEGLHQVQQSRLAGSAGTFRTAERPAPSARQVAFQIAPRINAAGRMDDAQNVIRHVPDRRSRAGPRARLPASFAEPGAARHRSRNRAPGAGGMRQRTGHGRSEPRWSSPALNWHRGVVGIVASRLVERFYRPVFVLSEEDGAGARIGPQHPAVPSAGRAGIDARPVHALRRTSPGRRCQSALRNRSPNFVAA